MQNQKFSFVVLSVFLFLVILIGCGANTPDAVFNRGVRAFQEGDPIGASLYFDDFIKKFPEDERVFTAYQALARCYFDTKDYASMRSVLEDIKKKYNNPNIQIDCDFKIGNTYYQEGFFDKAAAAFEGIAAATDNPRIQSQAYSNLAGLYARQTQAATAQFYYDKIYAIADAKVENPTESLDFKLMALSGKADVYKASGEFDQAREVYHKTLDLVGNATGIGGIENDRQQALINWAQTWELAGDYITAATMYDRLQTHPYVTQDIKPWLIIYKLRTLQNLFLEDNPKDKDINKLSPSEVFTPEEIALLVNENQRLVNDFSDSDFGISARVAIARLIHDTTPEEADQDFNEAIDLWEKEITNPPDPQRPLRALFQIADAYYKYGDYSKAKQTVQRIQQSYSQVPEAMREASRWLQWIEKAERDKAEAAQTSEKAGAAESGQASIPSATES